VLRERDMPTNLTDEVLRDDDGETLLIAEAQLLLAEKRTSLSTVRTGIAIVALPLSITSVLIATSKLYSADDVPRLLFAVLSACVLLFLLGCYMIVRALIKMRHYDQKLTDLRSRNSTFARLFDG